MRGEGILGGGGQNLNRGRYVQFYQKSKVEEDIHSLAKNLKYTKYLRRSIKSTSCFYQFGIVWRGSTFKVRA